MAFDQGKQTLPPLVTYPPEAVRVRLNDQDWSSCFDTWTVLVDAYSYLSSKSLGVSLQTITPFLLTFAEGEAHHSHAHPEFRRAFFRLASRVLQDPDLQAAALLEWKFLGHLSKIYRDTGAVKALLHQLWAGHGDRLEASLGSLKTSLISSLDAPSSAIIEQASFSDAFLPLLYSSQEAGAFIIAGADLLDSILVAYPKISKQAQERLLMLVYLSLSSITVGDKPNVSMLMEHLYSLRAAAGEDAALVADLVTETPFLSKTKHHIGNTTKALHRVEPVLQALAKHRRSVPTRQRRLRKVDKGKGKSRTEEFGHGDTFKDIHIHRMSLITQIQDLFPDLGSGFIVKLLDEYDSNVETVTAHLLDDSLPPYIASLDRTTQLEMPQEESQELAPNLAPRSTPPPPSPPRRRNVYDDDEFDRLAVDASRLHIGPKDQTSTAETVLDDRSNHTANKAAIMSALAAFDSDDDEHDDTYDAEDVGGTVDSARPGGSDDVVDDLTNKNEEALFRAWSMSAGLFERDSKTRRGPARQALKSETGMTDEAIEGWGVMVQREPRRLRRLELRYNTFGGNQQASLERTSWRAGEEDEDSGSGAERGGRGRPRGPRGGRGRGRGGRVDGAADDKGTQAARHRKEANKGSRANHNRRDQRARKVARAGFPG